jgi:hypothetical protein
MVSARVLSTLATGMALLVGGAASASAAGPPQIAASWVEHVTSNTANLRAEIDPNGLSTSYRFEYISEAAYLANLNAVPPRSGFFGAAKWPVAGAVSLGSVPVPPVFQHVEGLSPTTSYRYRPVATNSADTTIGPEHILATEAPSNFVQLPDNRGWELVSPVDKGGGAIAAPGSLFGGGAFQAASTGGSLTYSATTAFGQAEGAPPASQYLSTRGGAGWSTENISTPLASAAYGDHPDGAPYRLFSTDLATALLFGGNACRGSLPDCPAPNPALAGSGAPPDHMAYYLRNATTGGYASLLGPDDLAHTAVTPEHFEVAFAAATPDLSHLLLSSCAALTANATEVAAGPGECAPAAQNLYEWSGGGLSLVNLLPAQSKGTPGAILAAPVGAISSDGSRAYFTELEDGPLYLREAGKATVLIEETEGGGAHFQAASADGSVMFFTKGGSLYRFDATTATSDPLAGGVQGVLGTSADGSVIYFQDTAGLARWHAGTTTQLAPGADAAAPSAYQPPTAGSSRVSADGEHLAFLSDAEIPPFDNLDAESGLPDTELYLYGPPPGGGPAILTCASCNPTGERPRGSASIPGAQVNGTTTAYLPRVLSASGNRLFFDSSDALVNGDTDSRPDVYQWEAQGVGDCARAPGCVSLISGGRGDGGSFIDASADGSDAYFLSGESLVGADPGSIDVYDAKVGGGFAESQPPIPCVGDACQALPSAPDDPTPGTLVPNSGNPALTIVKEKHRKHKHRHRHRRHRHGGRR